jgi:hypothetical protein
MTMVRESTKSVAQFCYFDRLPDAPLLELSKAMLPAGHAVHDQAYADRRIWDGGQLVRIIA